MSRTRLAACVFATVALLTLAGCGGAKPTSALGGVGGSPVPSTSGASGGPALAPDPSGTPGVGLPGASGTPTAGGHSGGGQTTGGHGNGSSSQPPVTVIATVDPPHGQPPLCATQLQIPGEIRASGAVDVRYRIDYTITGQPGTFKGPAATLHFGAAGMQKVTLDFTQPAMPTMDGTDYIEFLGSGGYVATSRVYPYHLDCWPDITGIFIDVKPCNQLTSFTLNLEVPAGPRTQDIKFEFSDGTGYTRTYTLRAGTPQVAVYHRIIINSPLGVRATIVSDTGFAIEPPVSSSRASCKPA